MFSEALQCVGDGEGGLSGEGVGSSLFWGDGHIEFCLIKLRLAFHDSPIFFFYLMVSKLGEDSVEGLFIPRG